jgi:hypothetical protein
MERRDPKTWRKMTKRISGKFSKGRDLKPTKTIFDD